MRDKMVIGLALLCAGLRPYSLHAQNAGSDVQTLLRSAQMQSSAGDYGAAIMTSSKIIGLRPDLAIGYASRGMNEVQIGNRNGAIADLRKAMTIGLPAPLTVIVTRELGAALLLQHQYAEAITLYDSFLQKNEDWQSYRNRGNAHYELGQDAKALADIDKAIALHPDSTVYVLRAMVMIREKEWKAAEVALADANGISPNNPAVAHLEGIVRRRGARLPHLALAVALDHFRAGILDFDMTALRSDYATAPGFSADGWAEKTATMQAVAAGDTQRAADLVDKRLATHPLDLQALAEKADVQRRQGNLASVQAVHNATVALAQAMLASGDGLSAKTAWQVLSVDEEYLILQLVGLNRGGQQSLEKVGGHVYDRLTVIGTDGMKADRWFNIDHVYGHEL